MSAKVMDVLGMGQSKMQGGGKKVKKSLSMWEKYSTVSFTADAQLDFEDHVKDVHHLDLWTKLRVDLPTWWIPSLVGFCTALSGYAIEVTVDILGDLRLGWCEGKFPHNFYSSKMCKKAGDTWHVYEPLPDLREEAVTFGILQADYVHYIWFSTILATISAAMTALFAPAARGSGIPEIKCILGGFNLPMVLEWNTLIVKIIGLALSVAAGLSCGKEGPLVHIACCWSHVICSFLPRFEKNEGKQREQVSCACAAGVAVAFGAPLGGVLFSLEEASTFFPTRTMIRAFFAGSVAAMTLTFCKAGEPTTMFEAHYSEGPSFMEYPVFVLIGILGGMIGALFVHYNIQKSIFTAPTGKWRKRVPNTLEVCMIALITAITSFPNLYTRVISNAAIHALFTNCADATPDNGIMETLYGLCQWSEDGTHGVATLGYELMWTLAVAGFLRYVQMTFTFGCGAPSGLFIPSLYTGAALGRVIGIGMSMLNNFHNFTGGKEIYPGIYAMLGAAAVLGGVCRVTISLVVIMFELTGALKLIVPFMIVCMLAKWVGDYYTPGIYDYCITIRKYPFLHEPDDTLYEHYASDIMDDHLDCLHPTPAPLWVYLKYFTELAVHSGYPVTTSESDTTILGYLNARPVVPYLKEQMKDSKFHEKTQVGFFSLVGQRVPPDAIDLSRYVDDGVMRVVPQQEAADLHRAFRLLGIKAILVHQYGKLQGMITKKVFVHFMEEHHQGAELTGRTLTRTEIKENAEAASRRTSKESIAMSRQVSKESIRGFTSQVTPLLEDVQGRLAVAEGGYPQSALTMVEELDTNVNRVGEKFSSLNARVSALESRR